MKPKFLIPLAAVCLLPLAAKVIYLTPRAEDTTVPQGTRNFSGQTPEAANSGLLRDVPIIPTPLGELLQRGEGTVFFSGQVEATIEEKDDEKQAEDGSPLLTVTTGLAEFPFRYGRYYPRDGSVQDSMTRIFACKDGWVTIQRGPEIRLVSPGSIKYVSGTIASIPDPAAPAPPAVPRPGPGSAPWQPGPAEARVSPRHLPLPKTPRLMIGTLIINDSPHPLYSPCLPKAHTVGSAPLTTPHFPLRRGGHFPSVRAL